jgi:anti-sigma B factor antagonist
MSLDIAHREREGITLIDLTGRITLGDEAYAFRAAIENATASAGAKVILNMLGIDYVDSTGLGSMALSAARVRKADGTLKLLHVSRGIVELLIMAKMDMIFELFDDENEAVDSFLAGREIKPLDIHAFVKRVREE